jgi:hypothetical protein
MRGYAARGRDQRTPPNGHAVKAGDTVVLRSPAEILATLDTEGRLEGQPFMPEMLAYFGKTFTVAAQVGRACDTISYTGVRNLPNTVLLEDLRCDGSGHAGCGAGCRLYWNEAWLRAATDAPAPDPREDAELARLRSLVEGSVHAPDSTPTQPRFRCQATELLRASEPVGWYSIRSHLHELTSGNVGLRRFVRVMTRMIFEEVAARFGRGSTHPFRRDELAGPRQPTPPPTGNLRPGDLVRIRSKRDIRDTLGPTGKNRGLWFDREMVPYCGRTATVQAKVDRFIDETDGRLIELASDCYILKGVVCRGEHSDKRWLCPREIYPWWRESWLEQVEEPAAGRNKPNAL